MLPWYRTGLRVCIWMAVATVLGTGNAFAAAKPFLQELRTQQVGEIIYFHARFDAPADLRVPKIEQWKGSEVQRRLLARMPQLVPQDRKARAVYPRVVIPDYYPSVGFDLEPPRKPVPVEGLEFVGQVAGQGEAHFLLMYPIDETMPVPPTLPAKGNSASKEVTPAPIWTEVPVNLDFATTKVVPLPDQNGKRKPSQPPTRDDLQGLWAVAQAQRLAVLEALTPDFGFYGFACEATGRKYGVRAPMLQREEVRNREQIHRRLYETTTGSAAITESLQLHRMLNPSYRDNGPRTVDVAKIPGIDIAEHPWAKMMGAHKPSPEPLATLVPYDNFYVHFKSIRKFIEFGEVLDQWGTNLARAYEIQSRDYFLKEKYEKQLCLRSTWQGKSFGPAIVRSMALTGSDGYLREGSDITVLFHVNNAKVFLNGVEPFIQEARKELGSKLKETKVDYQGVWLESFVSPLREVSLNRATIGDYVIYSNSPVGLRRVIDVYQKRHKSLWDALDFQYMRTVYRLEDDLEDGFAFLSDAFIRQLVGPASKIKAKRRLEALTSLSMVTHAALFSGWESGKLPADHQALLGGAALKPEEIDTPEGRGVMWDPVQQTAASDAYNTLNFPTPLIELPIDKITSAEEQQYLDFRREYLNLWRKFFDPVGMRVSLNDQRVRVETYILPLIRHEKYEFLRTAAEGGKALLDPSRFSGQTLAQGMIALSPSVKGLAENIFRTNGAIGDWLILRVDDTAAFGKMAQMWVRQQFYAEAPLDFFSNENIRLLQEFPITVGIQVKDSKTFQEVLRAIEKDNWFGSFELSHLQPYKGVGMVKVKNFWAPALYHALIDDAWYISFSDAPLKDLIDQWIARREGKAPATKGPTVEINGSVYLAPSAAEKAGVALKYYLEWESHRRALGNCPIWYALYRSGLLGQNMPEKMKAAVAMRFFGFVPVSPDGTGFSYDPRTDEVVNRRHGSLQHPRWHSAIAADSPVNQLLDQFRTLRADLRFKEDGVNTTVTIERKQPKELK